CSSTPCQCGFGEPSCGCSSSSRPICALTMPCRAILTAWSNSAPSRCPIRKPPCSPAFAIGPTPPARSSALGPRWLEMEYDSAPRDLVLQRYTNHVNKSLAGLARLMAAPVEVSSAGTKVYGDDGQTYLDCGGFGVFLLGHCHPRVVQAVRHQLETH